MSDFSLEIYNTSMTDFDAGLAFPSIITSPVISPDSDTAQLIFLSFFYLLLPPFGRGPSVRADELPQMFHQEGKGTCAHALRE